MEEKERYEIHIYDDICVDLYDNGVLDKSINDTYKLEELLNQQDKRIKELQEKLSSVYDVTNESLRFARDSLQKLVNENQQLKDHARKAYQEGLLQKQFDKDMEIQELKDKIEQLKQSQKQVAIDELTRLKDFIDHNIEIENNIGALKLQEFYGNQIKSLKGEE